MKASLVIIASVASLLAMPAHGRVGETVKQVEARYGKPQKVFINRSDLRKVGYGYRGLMIIVYFSGGISKRESFAKPDLPKLPRETVNGLLALSARKGTSWEPILVEHGDYYWISSDKNTIAQFGAAGNVFLVQDRNFKSTE
jgi:hypothetical protein